MYFLSKMSFESIPPDVQFLHVHLDVICLNFKLEGVLTLKEMLIIAASISVRLCLLKMKLGDKLF